MDTFTGTLRTTQKKSMFVRALFNYDPTKDSGLPGQGLSFRHGDILHVTNASDDEWWQACKLLGDSFDQEFGIIPSKKRIERKDLARSRNVKFINKDVESVKVISSDDKKKSFFSKQIFFSRKKDKLRNETKRIPNVNKVNKNESVLPERSTVLSYQTVTQQDLTCTRPVILLGPLKDRFIDDLITEFPDQFACCAPHTTRPQREGEVEGREYHFMRSRAEMERGLSEQLYIEAGQYNGNMYGTSVEGIRDIAKSGRHCVLDVSANAIQRLHDVSLHPISILVRPRSIETVMDWHKRMTAEQARVAHEQSIRIEQEFLHSLTAIISGETTEEVYERVKDVINHQSNKIVWVPVTSGDTAMQ